MPPAVLVVDDDPPIRRMLERTLRGEGYHVELAGDGGSALAAVERSVPDAVVLDVAMPGLDGLAVCRRLRAKGLTALPILLLTARDAVSDRVLGLDAGADDYLVKPFDTEELRARVHVGIRVLTLQERLAERVAQLQDALSKVKQLNGLLPICSYCKRIRSDHDYWEQVESYIAQHSDAQFSHGICPTCYATVSAEIDEMSRNRQQQKKTGGG